ncbi:MAG: alanine--tRNA ligase-related protein [Candidatus Nanoarchaeia archaeon]
MKKDKLIKSQIIEQASANPHKYFPVDMLEELEFIRQQCSKCGVMFYATQEGEVCGDTNCVGEYGFIGKTPAKQPLEFNEVYEEFSKFMQQRGYTHVERFPIVARWRDDLDFNIASIIGFQPYVTKGLVEPPAKLVTIPQNCLRFGDIDNVGYTGRHGTNFVMIGQLAFQEPKNYDQAKYIKDLLEFFTQVVKIPIDEIQLHEDAWIGGGDCGPSIEFFSRGLELANQVYMIYDMSEADDISQVKELSTKVLDMGMGLERVSWFSKGSMNQYESTMPNVCEYLFKQVDFKPNWKLYEQFLPFSGNLNLDEVENIDDAWEEVAKHIGVGAQELKQEIEPIAGVYSIADHTKTLLYALHDGALPSSVKGGYNLRLVLRRAMDFITKYKWNIDLCEVIEKHVEEVEQLYPDMRENIENIKQIISHEVEKYYQHQEKVNVKTEQFAKQNKQFTEQDFIKLYISDGITPEDIKQAYEKKNITTKIPTNFFTLVNEYFEEQQSSEKLSKKDIFKEHIQDLKPTQLKFYESQHTYEQESKIIKEFDIGKKHYIVLDSTLFYPTMGGQACDVGTIGDKIVKDVIKVGDVILHEVE